ncbi:MAG: ABC transporter permease subunit [Nevskiaceae bacterium]|jgi:phosphate transport system permease protein|nr:MAG: ABC transporter permease subunit [Nevskiaceae bacterium]TAM22238.1 MAG: ABC transporter permease subunit [Nevskiaceae bacterium]
MPTSDFMSEPTTPSASETSRHNIVAGGMGFQIRAFKDSAARWVVWIGGLGVIAALMLIFFYLVSEVAPLFEPAEFKPRPEYAIPGNGETLYTTVEEQGEIAMRVSDTGQVSFFNLTSGEVLVQQKLPIGELSIVSVAEVSAERGVLAAALSDGSVLRFAHEYEVSYPGDKRLITPSLSFPQGEAPLAFMTGPASSLVVRDEGDKAIFLGVDPAKAVHLKAFETTTNMITGESTSEVSGELSFTPPVSADILLVEPLLSWLYVIDQKKGKIAFYRLSGGSQPELVEIKDVGSEVSAAHYLAGGISIVVAQADGKVSQWFPARKEDGESYLARVREFDPPGDAKLTALGVELRRRSFAVGDETGRVSVFYATSKRLINSEQALPGAVSQLAFNPRAQVLIAESADGKVHAYDVHNEHPEVSFGALWSKVWYESYDSAKWLWQSSSASADFEPKFSLTPLAFGTLKGAFYAMIFAVPLAVMGAIFVANFMSAELRQVVKPTVELLAALPSVILGFLAGLWLAPFIESNLPGVFLLLILLPISIPLFGYLWLNMPARVRYLMPAGWEGALLVPVIASVAWFCFAIAKPIEAVAFGGNMQSWMDHTLGIHYDQRNALVVGIAMGIAVIPTIFSIAEDAIFSVPKQLSLGSLALGASPWQTLTGVVLPTASPGIFSAIMIGLGRAVGETMIVLMATGNTPVTDASLFSGMRTLSANVAVEMPESEVGSTHFRLLFLAGLVLFIFTFFFNTLAEVVRARLRKKYASI